MFFFLEDTELDYNHDMCLLKMWILPTIINQSLHPLQKLEDTPIFWPSQLGQSTVTPDTVFGYKTNTTAVYSQAK